ncbi:MAG: hypothetical protein R3C17_10790 [Planctomycetaceae bacterium]
MEATLVRVIAFRVVGVVTLCAKAIALDHHRVSVMHQPINHRGSQAGMLSTSKIGPDHGKDGREHEHD